MMGIVTFLNRIYDKTFGRIERWMHPEKRKSSLYTVVWRSDGFIPRGQFEGSSLEVALTKATWSFACITANAEACGTLPGVVQVRDDRGVWVPDPTHELQKLVDSPLGSITKPSWGWKQFIETISMQLYLAGDSFLLPGRNGTSRLTALYPTVPTSVTVTEDDAGYPESYKLGSVEYKADQIIHIMNANPGSLSKGINPSKVAENPIQTDATARDRAKSNLENRISPGLIVTLEVPFHDAGDKLRTKVKANLESAYKQSTDDGSPLVLPGSAKVTAPPDQSKTVDYKSVREMARQEILAIYRTPAVVLGILQDVKYENYRTSLLAWWNIALFPLLTSIYEAINRQAIAPVYGNDVRLWYDVSSSQLALWLLEQQIDVAQKAVNLGLPANDAAQLVGLSIPYHEELSIPNTQFVIAGREEEPAAEEPAEEEVAEDEESTDENGDSEQVGT